VEVYSWHLVRLDFHYAALGAFGKTAVHKSLKVSSAYLDDLDFNTVSCGGYEDLGKISTSLHTICLISVVYVSSGPLIRKFPEEDQAEAKRPKKKDVESIRRLMDVKFSFPFDERKPGSC